MTASVLVHGDTGYDADGLLTAVGPVQLARSPSSGRLVSTTVGPVTTTYGYSQYGEVQTVTTSVSGAVLYTQGLQYDAVGNPQVSEESFSGATTQESYQHDAVGRLTSVTRNGVTTTYAYGPNSTRVRAGADVATFDAQDRLLAQGATTYTWDVHGNRATDSTGATYTHDGLGRLTGWTKGTTSVTYEVDALDRRVLRRRNGVVSARYVYEGQYRIVAELESGSRFFYAAHGHSPDAMVRAGVTYVFVKNHLGSVRAVVHGSTGQVVQALDYDAWGNVLSDSSPGFQPFGFAGGLYDVDSKLTHFGWRDYDPATGTWTSKDPIRQAGGLNVYLYANASPTRYIDPSGKLLQVLFLLGSGVALESTASELLLIPAAAVIAEPVVNWLFPSEPPTVWAEPEFHPPATVRPRSTKAPVCHDIPEPKRSPGPDPRDRLGLGQSAIDNCYKEASELFYQLKLAGLGRSEALEIARDRFEELCGFRPNDLENRLGF